MKKVNQAVNEFWKCAEELEAVCAVAKADVRSKMDLVEFRLIQGRILDAWLKSDRAARHIFGIPVNASLKAKIKQKVK